MSREARREERRRMRRLTRRRVRGGDFRAPVAVQRLARRVDATATVARGVGARAVEGDRPYLAVLVAVLVVAVLVLSGPLQHFLDARARADGLDTKAAALEAENDRLQQRVDDLNDPDNIELLAREQQGFIRPGEVPYAVVPPDVERPLIAQPQPDEPTSDAWYSRLWHALTGWFS